MSEWPQTFDALLRRHCRLVADDDAIDQDTELPALGVDSLEVVELIIGFEDEFGIAIPQELLTPQVFATPKTLWTAMSPLLCGRDGVHSGEAT